MAKRVNYGRDKRKKELERQKKREEKLARKRAKKEDGADGEAADGGEAPAEPGDAPGGGDVETREPGSEPARA